MRAKWPLSSSGQPPCQLRLGRQQRRHRLLVALNRFDDEVDPPDGVAGIETRPALRQQVESPRLPQPPPASHHLRRLERRRADDDVAATTTSGAVHMHSSSAATSNRIQLAGCLTATPLRARETYEAGVRSRRTRIVCASSQEATPSTGVEGEVAVR